MFRVDRPWLQCLRRAIFRGMPNRSMVPWHVHGGTILLPVCSEPATCHSHYCECLSKSGASRPEAKVEGERRPLTTDHGPQGKS